MIIFLWFCILNNKARHWWQRLPECYLQPLRIQSKHLLLTIHRGRRAPHSWRRSPARGWSHTRGGRGHAHPWNTWRRGHLWSCKKNTHILWHKLKKTYLGTLLIETLKIVIAIKIWYVQDNLKIFLYVYSNHYAMNISSSKINRKNIYCPNK